jgi:hypothetical protein
MCRQSACPSSDGLAWLAAAHLQTLLRALLQMLHMCTAQQVARG